jgi:hypothetical protein
MIAVVLIGYALIIYWNEKQTQHFKNEMNNIKNRNTP